MNDGVQQQTAYDENMASDQLGTKVRTMRGADAKMMQAVGPAPRRRRARDEATSTVQERRVGRARGGTEVAQERCQVYNRHARVRAAGGGDVKRRR